MSTSLHKYEMNILESHLDTFGHVNNATYLTLFEQARWDWITKRGYGLEKIQRIKQGPVVLDVHLTFRKELRLRETIMIETQTLSYEGKIGKVSQKMFNQKNQLACDAVFTFGLFDTEQRKLILPTDDWLIAVGLKELS